MKKFDTGSITEENLELALDLHAYYAQQLSSIGHIESTTGVANKFKSDIVVEQQNIQQYLIDYFNAVADGSKLAITTGNEILQRRGFEQNQLNEDGSKIEQEMIHIGLDFVHDQFNDGELFPLATYFSLFADSGVGKSDYFYLIANKLLMQNYKVMICSFEFGEQRLARLIDSEENGGKDRLREARLAGKFDDLFVNYQARDLESLSLMVDTAHLNGVQAILIDSFGELERNESEYILQQKVSMMLNAKTNDHKMFIGIIGQTKSEEVDGDYTVRGGKDQIFKPDLSIHVKKVAKEDVSGDRIVHLFKNRDSDWNGKTIVTEYNFETRKPTYKCDYEAPLADGTTPRKLLFGHSKGK